MKKTPEEAFKDWFDEDKEEDMYDVTGGDWDDMLRWAEQCYEAGWQAALDNLTTRDI